MMPGDASDIGVIGVPELGAWAERGDLAPVPAALRSADHPFQWTGLLHEYREQLISWGGQALAIPLAGDGYVIAYRADRLKDPKFVAEFQAQFGSRPIAPASWEDFADIAGVLAKLDGRPSLPPMTANELTDAFFRVAACCDRAAKTESIKDQSNLGGGVEALAFQFDLTTGKPRLTSPAFEAAAAWVEDLARRKCLLPLAPGDASDPVSALTARDGASIAVVSLGQLARLPRENGVIPDRFAIAPLPGSRRVMDAATGKLAMRTNPNYIPYFAGGRLGVVRTRCPNTVAAFDLLAELGGPVRSQEVIASTQLGAGPFRISHLEHDRLQLWYGYGFDAARTEALRSALLRYVDQEIKNPTYGLRGPDQMPLSASVAATMRKIATGTSAKAGLDQMIDEWKQVDAKDTEASLLKWRRRAAGVE
jgi:ABC-type glycerol-3-phosphate transport system substrate-binding protein